jgi:hypothetical protein
MRIKVPVVPASFFGMVIGLAGLGTAWRWAHQVWGLPAVVGEAIIWLSVTVWAGLTIGYGVLQSLILLLGLHLRHHRTGDGAAEASRSRRQRCDCRPCRHPVRRGEPSGRRRHDRHGPACDARKVVREDRDLSPLGAPLPRKVRSSSRARVAPTGLIAFLCSHPRSQRSRTDR